ncbi:MAG: type II toxin-antitoxin system VapC family toxin [Fusobacteriaceae bacterium]|jgi:PIN domain nuclease of toxin-antitoxin system|nr:type II toxin-antitoxin system VapC family toxin [Fusobacteriaceae bacterium]
MRYLLDTHALIWYMENSDKLPSQVREIIEQTGDSICISVISLWEIAIKVYNGKLNLKISFDELLDIVEARKFNLYQITNRYLKSLSALPFFHKDPFDRLLIATAIAEKMTLVTADTNIHQYNLNWIW